MYYDYNGNEIEDLEMDNMRRDAREDRMNRTFEVVSIQADDPESSGRHYYNMDEIKTHLPDLAPLILADDFHSLKLSAGLNSLEITVCSEEEDIEEQAWQKYQDEEVDEPDPEMVAHAEKAQDEADEQAYQMWRQGEF
jgi:hypothetical protein